MDSTRKVIIVVEDEPDIRESLRELLVEEGYQVHTAEHGKAALELLTTVHDACLIVLDLMMPVMDGWRFLRERDNHPEYLRIPVITVSASSLPAEGADAQLPKPVDLDHLLDTVASYCHRRGGACA